MITTERRINIRRFKALFAILDELFNQVTISCIRGGVRTGSLGSCEPFDFSDLLCVKPVEILENIKKPLKTRGSEPAD